MSNVILTATYENLSKSGVIGKHTLTMSVDERVCSNKNRLRSHCLSIGRKTYGNRVSLAHIQDASGRELYKD